MKISPKEAKKNLDRMKAERSAQSKPTGPSSVSPTQSHRAAEKWSRNVVKKADKNASNPPETSTSVTTAPTARPTRTVPNIKPTPGRAAPSYGMTPGSVGIGASPSIGLGDSLPRVGEIDFPISGPNFPISGPNFPISGPNYGFR